MFSPLTLGVFAADPHALTIECQVKVISRLLRDLLVDSTDVVYHVLLQFQAWYHIALFLALTATKSVSAGADCSFSAKTKIVFQALFSVSCHLGWFLLIDV